jgi:hypothetical protein
MHRWILAGLIAAAATPATATDRDALPVPALYASAAFGGAGGLRAPRLGARLEAPAGGSAGAPALAQRELRDGGSELRIAGLPLLATGDPALDAREDSGSSRGARIATTSVLITAVVAGAGYWLMTSFLEDFADGTSQAVIDSWSGGSENGSDTSDCTVDLAGTCVGGGG